MTHQVRIEDFAIDKALLNSNEDLLPKYTSVNVNLLLSTDMRFYGAAVLEPELIKTNRSCINRTCILQIVRVTNVQHPNTHQHDTRGLLGLRLTDGISTVSALALNLISNLRCSRLSGVRELH